MLAQASVLFALECFQVAELDVSREFDQVRLKLTSCGNFE